MCQTLFKSAVHKWSLHSNCVSRNDDHFHLIDEETEMQREVKWRHREINLPKVSQRERGRVEIETQPRWSQSQPQSQNICWINEWILINTERLWDSELGGHVCIFWAHRLAMQQCLLQLRWGLVLQILLKLVWQHRLTIFSNWGTWTIGMLFLTRSWNPRPWYFHLWLLAVFSPSHTTLMSFPVHCDWLRASSATFLYH